MANNIQIIGNILNVSTVSRYNTQDTSLIPTNRLEEYFGGQNDYIELHIYNNNQTLINSDYFYLNYKLPSNLGLKPGTTTSPNTVDRIQTENVGIESTLSSPTSSLYPIIEIDPIQDLQSYGYSSGKFSIRYNLFENKISNFDNQDLFVKEISKDRTEIRLASLTLSNETIEEFAQGLINEIENESYYVDYLLNFGDNKQYVAVNIALNKATEGYEILFKLYQPLPLSVQEKQTLWIVSEKVLPYEFNINLDVAVTPPPPPRLRGPNFDILVPNQGTVSTSYNSYQNLITSLQTLQSSSYQQILNLITSQSIDINVDYTDFDNFIFFGSATQRTSNFYTKVKQIEDYNILINNYTPYIASTSSLQTTINQLKTDINNVISQFDGYESYLYFESSSYAWPKSGATKPFSLLSTSSAAVVSWYNNLTSSAQTYDLNNYTNLEYAIPSYLKDDDNNAPFLLFLNMIGHYFDNIWVYLKSIPDLYKANNNLEQGISKDLVYHQLKSLGLHLYNSQAGDSVDNYLIGANTGSVVWDDNTTVTGSYLNNIPRKDLVAELYKRIYHNLPLLVKTKGTVAGLNHLMTIFGIPNQTYYTVDSESFYSPTGSSVTGSILSVKEFGGSLKSNLINGYNNDKVRIIPNNITSGNTLSPLLSLQTFPTTSSLFRENDMSYVDISFSPQTQIDTRVSGAIASNNPSWSLDDYIGDPRQLYNGSYTDLDAERKLYFETGVSGYAPFTGSLLNHNDFIRLIQYFDNALFKMLNDFVPERTSLSTGVTINSPVLERNKVVYANPTNTTTQSIYEGEISASSISSPYGTFYDALQNDKKPFFDGALSGSIVNVHQYFEDNYNPYLQPTGSVDKNVFAHSDWNVLLNNVSASVISTKRKKIEYTGNFLPTGSLTSSVELQDSYLTLRSYNTSRYEGIQLTSLKYNTYTSASYTGSNGITIQNGDKSFGKTAVIDRNSYKVGWVKNIPNKSLNFYNKTTIQLKYLIDTEQQITDLSARNNNVVEVQNIFKSGDPVILSLSDANKPSRQKSLDGAKLIYRGGYSFDPILFREDGENLNFLYTDFFTTSLTFSEFRKYSRKYIELIAKATGVASNATGYTSIWTDWNNSNFIDNRYWPNRPVGLSTTTSPGLGGRAGVYLPSSNTFDLEADIIAEDFWSYDEWLTYLSQNALSIATQVLPAINFSIPAGQANPIYNTLTGIDSTFQQKFQNVWRFDLKDHFTVSPRFYNVTDNSTPFDFSNFREDVTDDNSKVFLAPSDGTYEMDATFRVSFQGSYENNSTYLQSSTPDNNTMSSLYKSVRRPYVSGSNMKLACVVEKRPRNTANWSIVAVTKIQSVGEKTPGVLYNGYYNIIYFPSRQSIVKADDITMKMVNSSGNFGPATVNLLAGDELRFSLYFIDIGGIFSIWRNINYLRIGYKSATLVGSDGTTLSEKDNYNNITIKNTSESNYEYNQTAIVSGSLNTFSFYNNTNNTLIVSDPKLSSLFYTSSTFIPSTSSNTYENYSPVIDTLSIKPNDLIRIGKFKAPNQKYYTVTSVTGSVVTTYIPQTNVSFPYTGVVFTKDDPFSVGYVNNIKSTIRIPASNLRYFGFFENTLIASPYNSYFSVSSNVSINNLNGGKIFSIAYPPIRLPNSNDLVIIVNEPTLTDYTSLSTEVTSFLAVIPTSLNTYIIGLDRNVDTTGVDFQRDFAILRPKPDETSVIIDYTKPEGEVSQTILIPQDASDLLKSKVGDIFNNFNTNLSNQNIV